MAEIPKRSRTFAAVDDVPAGPTIVDDGLAYSVDKAEATVSDWLDTQEVTSSWFENGYICRRYANGMIVRQRGAEQ